MRSTILKTSTWLCALLVAALLGGQTTSQQMMHLRPGQASRGVSSGPLGRAATGEVPAQPAVTGRAAQSAASGLPARNAANGIAAQSFTPGPNLSVDAAANRHAISPEVYGINGYTLSATSMVYDLRLPVTRWGGDAASQFNWQSQTSNSGADWYFETGMTSIAGASVTFEQFHQMNLQGGAKSVGTVPIMGWVASPNPTYPCSFDTKKYTNQKTGSDPNAPHGSWTDPYNAECGSGVDLSGNNIANDPTDTDMKVDPYFMQQWVAKEVGTFGPASQGGIAIWELDNEPVWWSGTHRNIHPSSSTFDEITSAGLAYAQAVKTADPTAAVAGPITAGWWDLFFSNVDLNAGWSSRSPVPGGEDWKYWNNPTDRKGHGDIDFAAYYLQQFAAYEKQHGQRLLDYFDVHGYMPGTGGSGTDDGSNAKRLQANRVFWDPNFILYGNSMFSVGDSDEYLLNANPQWKTPQCVCLIPRMKQWIASNYPGTKMSITEYILGAESTLNGGLAQADLLGVFGREGLDLATLWGSHSIQPTDPVAFAFKMYRNYDGQGGAFGETSVSAASDNQDQLAIYAAQRSDSALTLMVINKTAGDLSSNIALNDYQPDGTVQVWQYSAANLSAIVRQPDQSTTVNGVGANFPAYSVTLLIVPEAASALAAKPVISAIVNTATAATAIAPGTLVKITGQNLGPATGAPDPIAGKSGLVGTDLSGVRVLFNGTPAPVLAASPATVLTIVPYTAGLSPASTVLVEYRNSRSDPFPAQVVPAAPGIFTADGTGQGPALAFSFDAGFAMLALNSSLNPASTGSNFLFYMTGAGVLDPPAVDGRIESTILPLPTQRVSVTIGGEQATVQAASAAGSVSGVLLVNVTVPGGVPAGNQPLVVTVGTASSQSGVTLAVK
jgi:uncharacterized protein (TIGR03437 family)